VIVESLNCLQYAAARSSDGGFADALGAERGDFVERRPAMLQAVVRRVRGRAEGPPARRAAIAATLAGFGRVEAVPDDKGRFRTRGAGAEGLLHFGSLRVELVARESFVESTDRTTYHRDANSKRRKHRDTTNEIMMSIGSKIERGCTVTDPGETPNSKENTLRTCSYCLIVVALAALATHGLAQPPERSVRRVAVVTGRDSTEPERRAADILAKRILKRSSVSIAVIREDDTKADVAMKKAELVFVVGAANSNDLAKSLMRSLQMKFPTLPNSDRVHPEAFAVKSGEVDGKHYVVIAGTEPRAILYGVGWILRAVTYLPDALVVPTVDAQEKPAFSLRGGVPSGPGSRAQRYGKLRPQTHDEYMEVKEDVMLLGTNAFEGREVAYGMLSRFGRTTNGLPPKPDGSPGFPQEWGANDGRSDRFICPSIPEARQLLLESYDRMFRGAQAHDFFSSNAGDPGGCRCERCAPYGATWIRLLHEIATLLHKYHPDTKILATNQDMSNESNLAIFEYLNSRDSSWLYAIYYGPGADEMQPYIRGPVNPRWFEYDGFGALGNYLKYMHHELPPTTRIALFSDITHWMQAQYGVARPDPVLAAVYGRRSWNARPRHFHRVAQDTLRYSIGDIHYTEGMHDDFNKWFWYRMLWNPNQAAETITRGYCRYWFGSTAQDEVSQAIFLMEETLEKPLIDNSGIAQAVDLLRSAGRKIPAHLLKIDYRWRVITQKALMDRYLQLLVQRGEALKKEATRELARAEELDAPDTALRRALTILEAPRETTAMNTIREEAKVLGEESNSIVGYRVPAVFIVDDLDLLEIDWWKKTLQEALASGDDARIRNAASMVIDYENPGAGGFYDNLGWPAEPEHLIHGSTLWGFRPFPGPARFSHYNLAYSRGRSGRGVTLAYDHLDPSARYVIRISIRGRSGWQRGTSKPPQLTEGLQADGQVLSDGFPVPVGEVTFQEFDLPAATTQDGKVEIALTASSEAMPFTAALEVWLMQKDEMPWTTRF
jgi:hypothetical protein